MYATGPPAGGRQPPAGGLRISAMARRAFPGPPGVADRPELRPRLREYLSDLVRPYRLTLAEDNRTGHSYGEMAAALIDELTSPDAPVDLVVLAFAIPDLRPGRATATYLSELCPGRPLAFAVCDQGAAAAFTGLRLVGEYGRSGGCQRALLLVVEQAGLPYDAGLPVDLPGGHRAVGLRCETASGRATVRSVRQHADVGPDQVARLLSAEIASERSRGAADVTASERSHDASDAADATSGGRAAGPGQLSLVADAPLAGTLGHLAGGSGRGWGGVPVRAGPAGQPTTGVWWELAGALPQAGRRVVLASYERQLRYLCLSTIEGGRPDNP